jgi:ligand-binding sensor domain-containing protein
MRLHSKKYGALAVFFSLSTLFFAHSVFSQSSQFRNYSIKEGLPSSEAYNVMQDSKGYMWFCTDKGVSRFDGYEFRNFNKESGLPDNVVFETKEDYKGRIWFRSHSGKLCYFYHDSIFRLPINDSLFALLKNTLTTSLAIDSSDNLYLGFYGKVSPLKISLKNNCSISKMPIPNLIYYLCLLGSSEILTGCSFNPAIDYATESKFVLSLYRDYSLKKIKSFEDLKEEGQPGHNRALVLHNGYIAASLGKKFFVLDSNYNPRFIYDFPSLILDLMVDKNNRIWITTVNDEPVCYDRGRIIRYPVLQFLKDKRITSMAIDNEGGLWFTSLYDGVYYLHSLNFKTWTTENGLPGNKVTIVRTAPDSSLWISTLLKNKIAILKRDSVSSYKSMPDIPELSINGILFTSTNSVWISSSEGVFILTTSGNGKIFLALSRAGRDLLLNKDGSVWFNGTSRATLLRNSGSSVSEEVKARMDKKILKIGKHGDKELWIATMNGLYIYMNDSIINLGNTYPILKKPFPDFMFDEKNNLWMASDTGIIIKSGTHFSYITVADGLISNNCRCISEDSLGNMWIGTKMGISHILLTHETGYENFHISAIKNIKSQNLNEVNCITCLNKMVYAGTNSGLTAFNMNVISADTLPTPIYITKIKVNGKSLNAERKALTLNYDENYIVINYSGLDYSDAGNIQYRYKMDGIDTGWVYTKNTNTQYPKLPPGNYTFLVSAMNSDGKWNMHPASIGLNILPPWWGTWWSRIISLAIIIGFLYWRIKAVQINERRKTQINKQLAMAELQKIKAQFNPHFLFNNLNTLSSLISTSPDVAQEFVDELSEFYHYTISHSKEEFIQVTQEAEHAKRYASLLLIRFGDRLNIKWNIESKYYQWMILTNSLQLLLENIVKHNNILSAEPLYIEIASTPANTIIVKNKIIAKKEVISTGMGLSSINERYKLLTGKEINVSHTSDFFSVELPLIIPKEDEDINN